MLPGAGVGQEQAQQRVGTASLSTPSPRPAEETLKARLIEVSDFLNQCHGFADTSLAAIGFPVDASKKAAEPIGLAGRVMEIRSETIALRDKLEILKNALE